MSEVELVLTKAARSIAQRRGTLLLRTVKLDRSSNNFRVLDNSPYIWIGVRSEILPEIGRVLESAVQLAMELDCPGGQYLLHDGEQRIAL